MYDAVTLPDYKDVIQFLKDTGLGNPLYYMTDDKKVCAITLDTYQDVPCKKVNIEEFNRVNKEAKINMEYDPRPFYFGSIQNEDARVQYMKAYDTYWTRYNEFTFKLSQALHAE